MSKQRCFLESLLLHVSQSIKIGTWWNIGLPDKTPAQDFDVIINVAASFIIRAGVRVDRRVGGLAGGRVGWKEG